MNDSEIADIRGSKDFKGITFSNFKKSDCKKQLLNALINGTIEPACYWSIEYICAGHLLELWEIILLFTGKYIHLGNPRLALYIDMRFGNFKDIIQNGYVGNELQLRNNPKIRILFAEIISILCLSVKKHNLSQIKIDKLCFNMANMTEKLKADNIYYAKVFFKKDDPKELFIALNEFAYHIKSTRNARDACFWLEWMLEFEAICKRDKKYTLTAAPRYLVPIESKFRIDIIWIIWEVLLAEAEMKNQTTKKVIVSLMNLFAIKYKNSCTRKRRFIIYNAISILTEIIDFTIPIYREEDKIKTVKDKIHLIYKEIKKGEKKPATDYLFNNSITKTSNIEKTLVKLDKMNSLNTIIYK